MRLTREPYIFVHALHWRKNGSPLVITHRHDQLVLEPFDETNKAQQWHIGPNGEIYALSMGVKRYIGFTDGCVGTRLTTTQTGGWVFDGLGEHPFKYRIVPRTCPSSSLRATLGSVGIGLEKNAFVDDSNGWYILTLREMTGKKLAHVRPMT